MISLKVTVVFLITISTLSALAFAAIQSPLVRRFGVRHNYNSVVESINKPPTMPDAKDLGVYLYALKDILDNCTEDGDFLDENYMGLFLAKLNLKMALSDLKSEALSNLNKNIMDYIINKVGEQIIVSYNFIMHEFAYDLKRKFTQDVYPIFLDDSTWLDGIANFQSARHTKVSNVIVETPRYNSWAEYLQTVTDRSKGVPNITFSDHCLLATVKSEIVADKCVISKDCLDVILYGSDYGFFMTHRIFMIFIANFGRGCNLFSPTEDIRLARSLCRTTLTEAKFIWSAVRGSEATDLLMEMVTLCSMVGEDEFLQRDWLNNVLPSWTHSGCVIGMKVSNLHLRSVTAGAISSAIRYIVNNL